MYVQHVASPVLLSSALPRYFGLGRTVMCLHQDAIYPCAVELPQMRVGYSLNAQLMWLKQEAAELCQVGWVGGQLGWRICPSAAIACTPVLPCSCPSLLC